MRGEYSKYIKIHTGQLRGKKKHKKFDLKMGREKKNG